VADGVKGSLGGVQPLSAVLWAGAVVLACWGLWGSDPRPRDTELLWERWRPEHVGDDAWELQLIRYANQLRPWHAAYGSGRRAVRAVSAARRQRVTWPPPAP